MVADLTAAIASALGPDGGANEDAPPIGVELFPTRSFRFPMFISLCKRQAEAKSRQAETLIPV